MRRAFTMIELIFAIVVIGILTTIAAPKFMATRDDAKVVSILANVKNAISSIKNAYANNPNLVKHNQDWYGHGGGNGPAQKNGGCISVFTYESGGQMRIYVSKNSAHNTCDLNSANELELYKRAEKKLGIQWGKFRHIDGILSNADSNYYIEQLSGLLMQ